jgi:hypothetical protein
VDIVTLPGCPWTATSNAGWVSLSTSTGTGPGQVSYQVLANPLPDPRTARITVGGRPHTVTQEAESPPCTYGLDPPARAFTAEATTAVVGVNTQPGCGWTATSAVDWVTVSPDSLSGTGTADVTYMVAENTTPAERAGSLTIGGQTHALTQAAAAPVCSYVLEPPSRALPATATTTVVRVVTQPGCAWTATSAVDWVTVSPDSLSGTGTADVTYMVAENTEALDRIGSLTVAEQSHTITQAGSVVLACRYSLSPAERLFGAAGGAGTVQVTTGNACDWNAVSSAGWVAVLNDTGVGTSQVSYQVAPVLPPIDRIATVVVNGESHSVIQRGLPSPPGGGRGRGGPPD